MAEARGSGDLIDTVGAFVPGPRVERRGAATGPLAGLAFAVKDLYDVAGTPTTYGNPDWARTHPVAAATAPVGPGAAAGRRASCAARPRPWNWPMA